MARLGNGLGDKEHKAQNFPNPGLLLGSGGGAAKGEGVDTDLRVAVKRTSKHCVITKAELMYHSHRSLIKSPSLESHETLYGREGQ